LIWLDGGPSHLETFDPKPDASTEIRGPFGSVATKIAGVRLNENLPLMANQLDQWAIVRSMTSPLGEHNFGTHYLMTGYQPTPALAYPTFGATRAHVLHASSVDGNRRHLPSNIAIPRFTPNIDPSGYLPKVTAPFAVGSNPDREDFQVRDLDLYRGMDLKRLDRRRQFVGWLDRLVDSGVSEATASNPDLDRAYSLITSSDAKRAFRLSDEDESVRRRYGRNGGSSIGQSCLLARRLVERGVPFVTVHSSGWDTHQNLLQLKERFPGDTNGQLTALDRALSSLVTDLSERGLLSETLVVVMGEFGRTPKINTFGGRDHWPKVFSVALAGGGVQGGQVIGQSDPLGEFPQERPVTPADLAATIYTMLGITPELELQTQDGRPVRVSPHGAQRISELIS
jgi:hypothetical protein